MISTHLHRVRVNWRYFNDELYQFQVVGAGQIGTKGLAIEFIADESDEAILNEVQSCFEIEINEMPDTIDATAYSKDILFHLFLD